MNKRCMGVLLALLLLGSAARAADGPPDTAEGWINFTPTAWDQSDAVRALAAALVSEASDRGDLPRLVHDWVCEQIYYDYDAFEQGIYVELSASEVLQNRKGVCESIANLVQSLLLEAGIPCIKVWGAAIPDGDTWEGADPERVNHTWNEFYLDGQWMPLDCVIDMGNAFSGGEYRPDAWKSDGLCPEAFAKTHRALQRGLDLPEQVPDPWAMPEIRKAAASGRLPLQWFRAYRAAVTERELSARLGRDDGTEQPVTRAAAATLLAGALGGQPARAPEFTDLDGCTEEVRRSVALLSERGVLAGTDARAFSPWRSLTRQEAIVMLVRFWEETDRGEAGQGEAAPDGAGSV